VLAETVANTYTANSTAPLFIGEFSGYPGGYIGLRGDIDELRIWNHARSQLDIQSNMNLKMTGSESGMAAYWDFDTPNGTTIADVCPNGNDGTLLGNAILVDSDAPVGPVPVVPSTWGNIKTKYDE
jgi:hypothetical protein